MGTMESHPIPLLAVQSSSISKERFDLKAWQGIRQSCPSRRKSDKLCSCSKLWVSFPSQNSSLSVKDLSTLVRVSLTGLRPPALDNRTLNPSQSPKPNY